MTTKMAKETGNTTSADNNRAHSDKRSRKNKCSSSEKLGTGIRDRVAKKEGNRVCEKNEKGTRGSKSSIKESTGGYKETSR